MNTLRCDILILGAGPAGMAAAPPPPPAINRSSSSTITPPWRTNLACGSAGDATGPGPALPRRHRRVSRHPGSERRAADCPPLRAQRAV